VDQHIPTGSETELNRQGGVVEGGHEDLTNLDLQEGDDALLDKRGQPIETAAEVLSAEANVFATCDDFIKSPAKFSGRQMAELADDLHAASHDDASLLWDALDAVRQTGTSITRADVLRSASIIATNECDLGKGAGSVSVSEIASGISMITGGAGITAANDPMLAGLRCCTVLSNLPATCGLNPSQIDRVASLVPKTPQNLQHLENLAKLFELTGQLKPEWIDFKNQNAVASGLKNIDAILAVSNGKISNQTVNSLIRYSIEVAAIEATSGVALRGPIRELVDNLKPGSDKQSLLDGVSIRLKCLDILQCGADPRTIRKFIGHLNDLANPTKTIIGYPGQPVAGVDLLLDNAHKAATDKKVTSLQRRLDFLGGHLTEAEVGAHILTLHRRGFTLREVSVRNYQGIPIEGTRYDDDGQKITGKPVPRDVDMVIDWNESLTDEWRLQKDHGGKRPLTRTYFAEVKSSPEGFIRSNVGEKFQAEALEDIAHGIVGKLPGGNIFTAVILNNHESIEDRAKEVKQILNNCRHDTEGNTWPEIWSRDLRPLQSVKIP
jgi:hypothetical protein